MPVRAATSPTASPSQPPRWETDATNNDATAVTTVDPQTASIAGVVYVDADDDGIQDAGEDGISGVTITLTGTDILGNTVNQTATTDANGAYQFDNLADGTYQVTQTQPNNFIDGQETVGNNATATAVDNAFNNLDLDAGVAATEFNFGEIAERLSKRRLLASST